jgi:EAL domain-containing protein (putative c-di-GMP-specific phosphodiesterase class I)
MPEIGKWMFTTLHRDLSRWSTHSLPPLDIAFNVCASQLDAPDFISWVAPLADGEILGHHHLVAEIDCDAANALSESRFLTFVKLREMGISLHLDHFGQGPVSLQTLHTYPFSLLKLNLASLGNMNEGRQTEAVIQTAIELAHQLGIKAGAVGVETQGQMKMLAAQRCDVLQGFFIGQPMTAQQLPGWLAKAH